MTKPSDFKELRIGDKVKRYFNPDNFANRSYHVRGFVDDMVIVRTWFRSKRRYEYLIWSQIEWDVYGPYQTVIKNTKKVD